MKIETLMRQGILVIRLEGEFDLHAAKNFREIVDKELDRSGTQKVLLNLTKINFIDSSGIGVILGRYKRLAASGGTIAAIGIGPVIKKIFELSGILKILQVFETEEEALLVSQEEE